MKNIIYISLIMLASCATVNQSESDIIQKNGEVADFSDQYEFNKAKLSKEVLKTFEPVAIEKFKELFEQIKIAIHPDYDKSFREEAKQAMAVSIMKDQLTDSSKLDFDDQLSMYLSKYANESTHSKSIELVLMKSPFQLDSKHVYKGTISFQLSGQKATRLINTYLVRTLKSFGNEEQEIWEVKFNLF